VSFHFGAAATSDQQPWKVLKRGRITRTTASAGEDDFDFCMGGQGKDAGLPPLRPKPTDNNCRAAPSCVSGRCLTGPKLARTALWSRDFAGRGRFLRSLAGLEDFGKRPTAFLETTRLSYVCRTSELVLPTRHGISDMLRHWKPAVLTVSSIRTDHRPLRRASGLDDLARNNRRPLSAASFKLHSSKKTAGQMYVRGQYSTRLATELVLGEAFHQPFARIPFHARPVCILLGCVRWREYAGVPIGFS